MTFQFSHSTFAPGPIEGYCFVWAYYVKGFRPDRCCQACFKGKLYTAFCTKTAQSGVLYELDELQKYPYVYICGVSAGSKALRKGRNLHLPVAYRKGGEVHATTFNGYQITVTDAIELPIPEHPANRCKNFQFGAAYFG